MHGLLGLAADDKVSYKQIPNMDNVMLKQVSDSDTLRAQDIDPIIGRAK